MHIQEVYINLDDSGKLTNKEKITVYGGLVFLSKKEKDKFITQYRSIINEIKCSYCINKDNCYRKCPEIKNTNIKQTDKRRIMNYIKKYFVIGLIIRNEEVYKPIIDSKAARGRFMDYAIRRMIKETIKSMIDKKRIDPNKPIKLIINIDEQTTKSNGYYSLSEGLFEELKYGIINYNYSSTIKPTIFNELEIRLSYQDSSKSYVVQAADLLAGTIRKSSILALEQNNNIHNNLEKFVNLEIILP